MGTGRCGSTLLSRMIRESPRVASIFEYWSGLDPARRFSKVPLDGPAFTELLCEAHAFAAMVLERGYDVPEVSYPLDAPGARFGRPSRAREEGRP